MSGESAQADSFECIQYAWISGMKLAIAKDLIGFNDSNPRERFRCSFYYAWRVHRSSLFGMLHQEKEIRLYIVVNDGNMAFNGGDVSIINADFKISGGVGADTVGVIVGICRY